MKVFGFEIVKRKAAAPASVPVSQGFWQTLFDWRPGAWQSDAPFDTSDSSVAANPTLFSCITLIAADIGKLRFKLVEEDDDGICTETTSAAFAPVLRKPNHFQNHIQFKEYWLASKLSRGNAYVLKKRDKRGLVVELIVLNPDLVTPLVAEDGSVFYRLGIDNLSEITEANVIVPASEIIHDRMNCLFHPLVGLSPIFACGLAAQQGLSIQTNYKKFFTNMSRPGGILTAPGAISNDTAARLKESFESGFSGINMGKLAVAGDGIKFEPLAINAVDSQMIEQLKWTDEKVCSCFHMPPFKVGVGQMPTYQNGEVLNQIYYSDCLQGHIESMELCLDEGLGLDEPKDGVRYGVELDLDGLLRMDQATQIKTLSEGVGGAILSPNEARARLNRKPMKGGDALYAQQQDYSLEALAKRDAKEDPFGSPKPAALPAPPADGPAPEEPDQTDKALHLLFRKSPESLHAP